MKFNGLFKNRRNIYFTVLILVTLLLAGGLWQYRNYIVGNNAQNELQKNLEELYGEEAGNNDTAVQIVEDTLDGSVEENVAHEVANTEAAKKVKPEQKSTKAANPSGNKQTNTQNKASQNEKSISAIKMEEPKLETMVIPVFGTAYAEFADQSLIYSKTLDEWTTHNGIDIKADEGSPVRAAMDGIVEELKNDPALGLTIILNHGNDVFTKYSNLSTLDLVNLGQKVKKGDVISGIGKTALYEVADEPHLHFEVVKNNKNVDPKKYLPKQSLKR